MVVGRKRENELEDNSETKYLQGNFGEALHIMPSTCYDVQWQFHLMRFSLRNVFSYTIVVLGRKSTEAQHYKSFCVLLLLPISFFVKHGFRSIRCFQGLAGNANLPIHCSSSFYLLSRIILLVFVVDFSLCRKFVSV